MASGEGLIYETRPSFAAYFAGPITRFVFFFLVFFVYPLAVSGSLDPSARLVLTAVLFLVFVLPFLLRLLIGVLRWTKTAFAVTDRRILVSTGVISRNLFDCAFDKIQNVTLHQGIFARLFGYGNLVFATAGVSANARRERAILRAGGVYWRGVKDPVNTRRFVEEVRTASARVQKMAEFEDMARVLRQSGTAMPGMPMAGPASSSIPPGISAANAPTMGPGVAMRTRDQIAQLEQAIQQQRDMLSRLQQGLAEGRIENKTYDDISRQRAKEIEDLEQQLVKRKAQLASEGTGGSEAGPRS